MERASTFDTGAASSSASMSSSPSSTSPSRRSSFSILEKPTAGATGLSSIASFANINGLSSAPASLLPMPVLSRASSAFDIAKSSLKWLPTGRIELPSYAPLSGLSSPLRSPTSSPRLRAIFGHCLYRRVLLWIGGLLCALLVILLVHSHTHHGLHFRKEQPSQEKKGPSPESIWVNYTRLDGYYNGIRTIVPIKQYHAEYPTAEDTRIGRLQEYSDAVDASVAAADAVVVPRTERTDDKSGAKTTPARSSTTTSATKNATPKPTIFNAHPDYNSSEYRAQYYPVQRCYLDAANQVPVPDLWAYPGVPQGQPEPLLGSHSLLGLREDVCFDRFGRYGPYGLGYKKEEGGTGLALDTESEGANQIWSASTSGKIDYSTVDWASAQRRCFAANEERFVPSGIEGARSTEYSPSGNLDMTNNVGERNASSETTSSNTLGLKKIERTAVVMRCYAGFKWSVHSILNLRALVSELSLRSGGEYDVHILLHARDENIPVWADAEVAEEFIADNIPREFRGLVSLWSEGQMRLLYPGMRGQPTFDNPANADIHGVYRSPHLPLQHFAQQHPEYAHYWNWEMDMRFLGSYYEFFDRLGSWAEKQPRRRLWERSAKYYIPALHGSWENFTARVDAEAHEAGRPSILGELYFAGRTQTRDEEHGVSPLPAGCEGAVLSTYNRTAPADNRTASLPGRHFFADRNNNYTNIPGSCGVGEAADLITLNPMFDAEESGWVFSNDVTGYDLAFAIPPRRTAIITASRLSRRLLFAMHEETWRLHHGMFAEMFPPSVALHRGFKAVYAPHPVYADRHWPLAAAEKAFNAGPDHSSGASDASPFHPGNEHYHRGLTWYYNSDFAGRLWRRWLGYLQPIDDPAAPKPKPVDGQDDTWVGLGGGAGDEAAGSGRMCMRSVLVHPIKFESLAEIFS
ncbi:uncharacterized protein SPSK_03031 [Sporothrix schenckii 1099-18]|uniref:Major facilitator superfamily transporter n=1 Tax=Sporothrix schenckii 1099-18 TaxID=1397361 RepID=A0A0F2LZD2_SPOSC|nr:uncharacterized protein SPSK_03031 [Sporothrix schenckii 1099-18]KJR82189.1 hypothetical protein SPSK_03031 [Sporothrix schenckii 1099-18]